MDQIKKVFKILFEMLKSNLITIVSFIAYIILLANIIDKSHLLIKILLWLFGYIISTLINHLIVFKKIEWNFDIFNESMIWLTFIYLVSGWAGYTICIFFTAMSLLLFFAERLSKAYIESYKKK